MYTNYGDISLTLAVWLAADDGYDYDYDPKSVSATTLLNPLRCIVLSRRVQAKQAAGTTDLEDLVQARLGQAVHTAAEVSWMYSRDKAFANLGIAQKAIDRIVVNPDKEDDPDAIYVYIEQRTKKEVDGWYVSGKFDFVYEGKVRDIKTTKTYNWIHGGNDKKYAMQASIYRWLNPEIITDVRCDIDFLFTDWSPLKALADRKQYPQKRIMTRTMKLMPLDETDAWIRRRIFQIKTHMDLNQSSLPKCTPEELWQQPLKFAYYKKAANTARATKLYDTMAEASARNSQDGNKGKIVKRESEPKYCNYCDARPVCMQAAQFIEDGVLKL
jgi:hypothetical protein